jgi:hypothetical protein
MKKACCIFLVILISAFVFIGATKHKVADKNIFKFPNVIFNIEYKDLNKLFLINYFKNHKIHFQVMADAGGSEIDDIILAKGFIGSDIDPKKIHRVVYSLPSLGDIYADIEIELNASYLMVLLNILEIKFGPCSYKNNSVYIWEADEPALSPISLITVGKQSLLFHESIGLSPDKDAYYMLIRWKRILQ